MTWQRTAIPAVCASVAAHVPADGSDAVLFEDETRRLHRLAGTAVSVWSLIDGVRTVDDIVESLIARYGGDRATIAADVDAMLTRLATDGVVECHSAPGRR